MLLVLMRHGRAEDRLGYAAHHDDDAERPLTAQGIKRLHGIAAGLLRLVPALDALITSPLARAQQTAAIVAEYYPRLQPVTLPALAPGQAPEDLRAWLERQNPEANTMLVGHEPGLSVFAAWLLTGRSESLLELKKGALCLLRVTPPVQAGKACLLGLWQPKALRRLMPDS